MSKRVPKNITADPISVNIHQVLGELTAIRFLQDADVHLVEGLFLQAKLHGHIEFRFHGRTYVLLKNDDLTYTIETRTERAAFFDQP